MALYCIADLHLSTNRNTDKKMDVFGNRWQNYHEKIDASWRRLVEPQDAVILPGDISWATRLEEAEDDFSYLDSLPGEKYIGKGNHDFWWATAAKLQEFFRARSFNTLHILYNNAYRIEDKIVCGTRGWFLDEKNQVVAQGEVDYDKIVKREAGRLKMSLDAAKILQSEAAEGGQTLPILAFLHFPPVWSDFCCRELIDLLLAYGVNDCYFGHIHGCYSLPGEFVFEGIRFHLIAADYLSFAPLLIR